jgi:hypothetical protein
MKPMLREEARERQIQACGDKVSRDARALLVDLPEALSPNRSSKMPGNIRDIAGRALSVSGSTIDRAEQVKAADPDAYERIRRGEVTVEAASRSGRNRLVKVLSFLPRVPYTCQRFAFLAFLPSLAYRRMSNLLRLGRVRFFESHRAHQSSHTARNGNDPSVSVSASDELMALSVLHSQFWRDLAPIRL